MIFGSSGRPSTAAVPMQMSPTTRRRVAASAALAGLLLVGLLGAFRPVRAAADTTTAGPSATPVASALAAATASPTAASTPTAAVAAPAGSIIDAGFGGLDLFDLTTKLVVVLVLLFITLRVLGRMQSAGPKRGGRLEVLETRSLAPKASLHLVKVGDRRLVVGLTPNGMVSLAELKAEELESSDFADELAAQTAAAQTSAQTSPRPRPLFPAGSPLNSFVAPIDAFAGRVAALLGGGRAR